MRAHPAVFYHPHCKMNHCVRSPRLVLNLPPAGGGLKKALKRKGSGERRNWEESALSIVAQLCTWLGTAAEGRVRFFLWLSARSEGAGMGLVALFFASGHSAHHYCGGLMYLCKWLLSLGWNAKGPRAKFASVAVK